MQFSFAVVFKLSISDLKKKVIQMDYWQAIIKSFHLENIKHAAFTSSKRDAFYKIKSPRNYCVINYHARKAAIILFNHLLKNKNMKKIYLFFLFPCFLFSNSLLAQTGKPGSGNSIQLTGTGSISTSPYINIGSGFDFGTQPFTYETWIKRDVISSTLNNYGKILIVGDDNGSWGVGIFNDNTLYFTKVNFNAVASTGKIDDTKWHHVAVVYTGTQIQFYIDGVAAGNPAYTSTFTNTSGIYIIGPRQSFGNSNGDQTLDGQLDETRIWKNVALTQTQIKDWMCRKITSAHPEYANLFAYYQLDEGSGTTTSSIGGHDGTLVNNPMWKTSGASLGDASAYDYTNATKTVTLAASTGEKFTATSTSGNPAGIQVYRVDEQPNSLTGTTGVGDNDKYFGVFQIGGTTPQYTAVYDFAVNPYGNAYNHSTLRLFKRADNSVDTWDLINTLPDQIAKTITVAGQSTEYILGSVGSPLPVTLNSFSALKQSTSVFLNWSTENEKNFSHFEIERAGADNNFVSIGTANAHNNASTQQYTFKDEAPQSGINLYRLRLVDIDGKFSYSKVASVVFNNVSSIVIYPNPAKDYIQVLSPKKIASIQITDMSGKVIKTFIQGNDSRYSIRGLHKGLYILKITDKEKNTISKKLLVE
jgi:hypothetical protein